MRIEYCDKCKKPIMDSCNDRHELSMRIGSHYYSSVYAEIVLCNKCYEDTEIENKVRRAERLEENPSAADEFLNLFKQLVAECVEELR